MTAPLRQNFEFRRLYYRGKSAQGRYTAVYCLKNRLETNRLGITVGAKVGCAVKRNRLRRLIKEAYRLSEARFKSGYDIVVVGRSRGVGASFREVAADILIQMDKLGVTCK